MPRPRTIRLAIPLLGFLAVAGLLGACGGASSNGEAKKAPAQILKDAQAATSSASSVRVSGSGTSSGSTLKLDIVAARGTGGGSFTSAGVTLQIVLADSAFYFKGDNASLTKLAGAATAQQAAGKWIKDSTSDQSFAQLANLLDVTKLAQQFAPQGALTKGATTTFGGSSAIVLTATKGGGTLYVAATGKPYILGIKAGTGDTGIISFASYNQAKAPGAPAGSISVSQLQGAASGG